MLILYLIDLVGNRPIHYKNLLLLVISVLNLSISSLLLFSRNPLRTRKIFKTTGKFSILPLYSSFKIIECIVKSRITRRSLLTVKFLPLKLQCFHFTIILSMLLGVIKLPVFVYSISLLLLTIAYLYGLGFMVLT